MLEASVEALAFSEDTLPKLTEENQHLQEIVSKLSKQLEETEERLEEQRAARTSLEQHQEAKIETVERSWAAVMKEKKDNWEAKERSLVEKVENQERLLREIKASYEVSQRLDRAQTDDREDVRGNAVNAELEIMTSDLERTSLRLAEVEARNEQLRLELAHVASQSQIGKATSAEEDPSFIRIQSENSSLRRKLDAARIEIASEKRALEGKLRGVERDAAQLRDDRNDLHKKIQRWSDYDEIRRELDMLKVRYPLSIVNQGVLMDAAIGD